MPSKEVEVSSQKRYDFPIEVREIHHDGKIIVVSPATACWIVLDNESQLQFFNLLRSHNLEESLSIFKGAEDDAMWVVTQLEARSFEKKETVNKQQESSAHIYLTNKCNMRCPHCYMFAGEKFSDELSDEEILQVIEGLAKGGVQSVVFSGGEPLLNVGLQAFVKKASALGMKVEILSNGTLWSQKLIDEISPYLDRVQISIDGFDETSNASVRGEGNFEKALSTVDTLLKKGVRVAVAMVPKWSETLERDAPEYVEFIKGLLGKYSDKLFDFNIVGDLWEGRNLKMSGDEQKLFKNIISGIFREIYGENSEDDSFIEFHRRLGIEENCAYGNLSIAANGDVFLCAQIHPLHPLGNIRTDSIEELLKLSDKAKSKSEVSQIQPCSECEIRYICGGDCRIKHFSVLNEGRIPSQTEIPTRECTREYKESMYDLMIRTNEYIFQ